MKRKEDLRAASAIRDGVIQLRMNNVTTRGQFIGPLSSECLLTQILLQDTGCKVGMCCSITRTVQSWWGKQFYSRITRKRLFLATISRDSAQIKDQLYPAFLSFWLQAQWKSGLFANICNRWIGTVPRSNGISCFPLQSLLPSLPEQKRISAILNEQLAAVERARAAAEAQLEAAKNLPAAYLRDGSTVQKHRSGQASAWGMFSNSQGDHSPTQKS